MTIFPIILVLSEILAVLIEPIFVLSLIFDLQKLLALTYDKNSRDYRLNLNVEPIIPPGADVVGAA